MFFGPPKVRTPIAFIDGTPERWINELDHEFAIKPPVQFDTPALVHPDNIATPDGTECGTPAAKAAIATFHHHAEEFRKAQTELTRARNPQMRANWEREVEVQRQAMNEAYSRVSRCLT